MSNSTKSSTTKVNGSTKTAKLPTPEEIQAALTKQIEDFQQKNELIHNRAKFLNTREELTAFIKDQGTDYNEFMEDSGKKVVFIDNERYSSSSGISITNNYLVREFAQMMIEKIDIKVAELNKQIMS